MWRWLLQARLGQLTAPVIDWVNADLVTHVVPRVRLGKRWALVKPSTTNRDAALQPAGTFPATTNAGEFGLLHPVFRDC